MLLLQHYTDHLSRHEGDATALVARAAALLKLNKYREALQVRERGSAWVGLLAAVRAGWADGSGHVVRSVVLQDAGTATKLKADYEIAFYRKGYVSLPWLTRRDPVWTEPLVPP